MQTMEYQLTVPAGDRWFEGRTAVLPVDITEKRCVVFTARDISDTKRAEELESQNVYLREELNLGRSYGDIVGASDAMRAVFKSIEMVAPTDSTVLILGETGTGKELMAGAIHEASRRRRGVMVKVNCAALPPALVESELFGHERGAFTGAVQQKKGRFELAHRGTIFLDEIGELPLEMQAKLLRVLQEQELERLGGTQTIKVDVRVVAATNRDLSEAVRTGAFRADLFYRLNIFPVRMPPLRERLDDIPVLAAHFVRQFAERMGKPVRRIAPGTLERLARYDWPGNVRELANVLERAVILSSGTVIQDEHIGPLAISTAASAGGRLPHARRSRAPAPAARARTDRRRARRTERRGAAARHEPVDGLVADAKAGDHAAAVVKGQTGSDGVRPLGLTAGSDPHSAEISAPC